MGAFHEGHLSLMRASKQECKTTVVSLFVNPTQFGPNEDFANYPRTEESDFSQAEMSGVDLMFAPSVDEMYAGSTTSVHVTGTSEGFEGKLRPGHFDGVATVVLKLFNIVQPQKVYFGVKDLQQCAVINNMVRDLCVPVEVRILETVREASGLALSSRNQYLDLAQRELASTLYKALVESARRMKDGSDSVPLALSECREKLSKAGFVVDYVELVDPSEMVSTGVLGPGRRIVAAVRLGGVRLLDNVPV